MNRKRITLTSLLVLLLAPTAMVCAHEGPELPPIPSVNLHGRGIEDHARMRSDAENKMEFLAYYDALLTAHGASNAGFARGARHDIPFVSLWEDPSKYRGDIIHIEGRLYRVRKLDAAFFVHDMGVRQLYEGWVYTDNEGTQFPWCIVFTDPSPGITTGERMDVPVSFDGFFFKRYRYLAKSGKVRECLLLIGHSPVPDRAAAADARWPTLLIVGLASLVGTTITLVVLLTWWYKRTDRRVRDRLAYVTGPTFEEPASRELTAESRGDVDDGDEMVHEVDSGW